MSRGRNRNIRALPIQDVPLYFPLPEEISISSIQKEKSKKISSISNCFGEHVHSKEFISPRFDPNFASSSALSDSDDEELEKLIWGFRDLGGKSSSSSLSWGEDCGSEAAKKVREELERMDRVLGGLEPIPPNYDKEEYEEWMEFFPNLCAVGNAMKTPNPMKIVRTGHKSIDGEEILAIHPEDCDTPNFLADSENLKNQIKKAVIEQVYGKVTDRLSRHNPAKSINESRDSSSLLNVDNYLKISQSVFRERSSKYLISSHISSSKWLKDDSECASLPFLHDTFEKVQTRTSYSNKELHQLRPVKGILKNSLTLPPIESSQFRSISATPRRPANKCLSALSVNAKSRLDSSSYHSELMYKQGSYRKKSGIGRVRTRKKIDDFK